MEEPKIDTAITATGIEEGQKLSDSTINGTFKNTLEEPIDGVLAWTTPGTTVDATGNHNWTFTPTDLETYSVKEGTVEVVATPVVVEPTDPVIDTAVSATEVNEGETLAESTLSGTFKDGDGAPVAGDLTWVTPETSVATTGDFNWRFTPTDGELFNEVTGTVNVKANPVADRTPIVDTAITATKVDSGETLAKSTLSGAFKDSLGATVEGTLEWTTSSTVVSETGSFDWTFKPTNSGDYDEATGTVEVVATPVADKTVLVDTEITATEVYKGRELSESILEGTFKDSLGVTVEGVLDWTNPEEIVDETGEYNWTFTPTERESYDVLTKTVQVTAKTELKNRRKKTMSIVWRDKVLSSYNGNLESVIVTDAGADYPNGLFITLGELADKGREVKNATLATTSAEEVLLVASPEVMYEAGKHIGDFLNEEEGVARAFRLSDGDVITLTNDLVGLDATDDAPAVGTEFTVTDGKLAEGATVGPISFKVREGAGYELTRDQKAVRFDIVK